MCYNKYWVLWGHCWYVTTPSWPNFSRNFMQQNFMQQLRLLIHIVAMNIEFEGHLHKDMLRSRSCYLQHSMNKASHLTAFYAWNSDPHLLVTPVQLMRPGIGRNVSCAVGDLALFPGSRAWAGRKEPGTHCLRMLSFPRISGNLEISRKTCSVTLTSARTPASLV